MEITSFIKEYINRKNEGTEDDFVEEHIKTTYVPYEEKADIAKAIISTTCYRKVKDLNGDERTELYIDSIAKHMLKCISLIDLYTDIERQKNGGRTLNDFNSLNEIGLIDKIIVHINQKEIKEFNMILNMTYDDLIANEYEPHSFIKNQIERFGSLIGTTLLPLLENLDIEKINESIAQVGEKL